MKMKWCATGYLLLLLCVRVQLHAQQTDADRKLFEDTKAKAQKGDAKAQATVGWDFYNGIGVIQDYTEAVKWYREAAEQNNADAQYSLGSFYGRGQGVTQDYGEMVKWYHKAAEQGLAVAQSDLGCCYYEGQGVPKDEVEAVKWYRKAADQGYAEAQYYLASCYYNGQGVAQDYSEAVKLWRKAAEQNNAGAQCSLGICYGNGQGVAGDEAEALKWYRKAADQNLADGQYNLGLCYNNGEGVAQDYAEAVKWYRKAAEQDFTEAQNNLGVNYAFGAGVVKDYVEAYKWLNLAAARGFEKSRELMAVLENKITPEQIAEAQQQSAAFIPQKETPDSNFNSISPVAADSPIATGTGFFITDDGYLISNYHVVKDATKIRLVTSAGLIDAKVVSVDAANDLALLKADGRFASLPISSSRTAQLGGTVATIGFPDIGLQGFAPKLAKGEIASLSGAADDPRYFQISVPVQPGNSGGALVDERGNVIGIVSAKLDASVALAASGALPENVNYAVKSSLLLSFLESVPDVDAKLKTPVTVDRKFEDVVQSAQSAAVLVLVY
jgi:uncharacterized protein